MTWRKSSFSGSGGNCVEIAATPGTVHLRSSQHPDRSVLALPPAVVAEFVAACQAGEYDHLTH